MVKVRPIPASTALAMVDHVLKQRQRRSGMMHVIGIMLALGFLRVWWPAAIGLTALLVLFRWSFSAAHAEAAAARNALAIDGATAGFHDELLVVIVEGRIVAETRVPRAVVEAAFAALPPARTVPRS